MTFLQCLKSAANGNANLKAGFLIHGAIGFAGKFFHFGGGKQSRIGRCHVNTPTQMRKRGRRVFQSADVQARITVKFFDRPDKRNRIVIAFIFYLMAANVFFRSHLLIFLHISQIALDPFLPTCRTWHRKIRRIVGNIKPERRCFPSRRRQYFWSGKLF